MKIKDAARLMNFRFLLRADRNLGEFKFDENINIVAENTYSLSIFRCKKQEYEEIYRSLLAVLLLGFVISIPSLIEQPTLYNYKYT